MYLKGHLLRLVFFVLVPVSVHAQDSGYSLAFSKIDTAAFYDSIMTELQMLGLAGKGRKSILDLNMGVGNGSFALQNQQYNVNTNHLFFNAGAGYYHKSGLSFSSGFNFTSDQGTMKLYQVYVSPSYDYQNRSFAVGFSGFRYFNDKDLTFYVSPLVNELYGYAVYKKWWLQPKLAIDYAWGTYDQLAGLKLIDTVRFRRFAPIVRYLSKQQSEASVSDFSLLLTLRHDFISSSKKNLKNWFRYTPSVTVLAGTANYGTNTPLSSLNGPRLSANTDVLLFKRLFENAFAPPPAVFSIQNLNFSQSAAVYFGKLYIQGQLVFSYIIPSAQSRWNVFYNLGTGISL